MSHFSQAGDGGWGEGGGGGGGGGRVITGVTHIQT